MKYTITDFTSYFEMALKQNFIRGLSKMQIEFLKEWYKTKTGQNYKVGCMSCNHLQFVKECAKLYYEENNNQQNNIIPQIIDNEEVIPKSNIISQVTIVENIVDDEIKPKRSKKVSIDKDVVVEDNNNEIKENIE